MVCCNVLGCEKTAQTRGMCVTHYNRYKRSDEFKNARPTDWGQKEKHPNYQSWRHLFRKGQAPIDPEWNDFWKFNCDVGNRPDNCVLKRKDETKPIGPVNFFWRERQVDAWSEKKKFDHAKYIREYRKMHPERFLDYDLKRSFGIGVEEYNAMLDVQNGVCDVCKRPETSIHKSKTVDGYVSKVRRLAVDHCHATGKIRALLCGECNKGLGCFGDNEDRLFAAIEYLEKYRKLHAD